ncbi:hypothetical protein [Jidongwangia harbinensis]|uniref:hypothetical protein n=1 Tax=Jidongwangia harbinensis TaxID=2878561 RepID=UPI001CD9B7C9|nr:hypothetical protein [Jidongwangia harbinensis]MCA2217980.1 hypothetical protein [Jidongwangia harbinensis]
MTTRHVSESVRALGSFPDADYADEFSRDTPVAGTPERWARAMFGDVPSVAELAIWRGLLQLRLSPGRSPTTVAGWRIGGRGADWIRLEAASWFLAANLLIHTGDRRVSLVTLLRYDHSVGHVAWPPLSAVHRSLVPGVLRTAEARMRADR